MLDFFDDLLGISDFIDYSGLAKLTAINRNLLLGLFRFFEFNRFLKIIALIPFLVYLFFSFILTIGFFLAALFAFIPYQLGRIGNVFLNLASDISDSNRDGFNFFGLVFLPLLIYLVCILALICLIVPKLLLASPNTD